VAAVIRIRRPRAEYKDVVIFLKYIFEEQHTRFQAERAQGADRGTGTKLTRATGPDGGGTKSSMKRSDRISRDSAMSSRDLQEKRDEILRIADWHGARNVRVFGSDARGEANEDSDIDFLVDFESDRSLLDHAALVVDLEELLGRKVDVVTERGLYWLLQRRILKEAWAL
jgi:uncharacterized protein